jgi:hypothetical protein
MHKYCGQHLLTTSNGLTVAGTIPDWRFKKALWPVAGAITLTCRSGFDAFGEKPTTQMVWLIE